MARRFRSRDLLKLYGSGLPACVPDRRQEREFNSSLRTTREAVPGLFARADRRRSPLANVLAGDGALPRRVLLWRTRERFDPGVLGAEAQTEPDCTSKACQNAIDRTRIGDFVRRGDAETFYARTASEPIYGMRGSSRGGMSPQRACQVTQQQGYLGRLKYPEVDLRKYRGEIGAGWGRRGVPQAVLQQAAGRHVIEWVRPESVEQVRQLTAAHCGGFTGLYFGWKPYSDARGLIIPDPRHPWNHAMGWEGFDFTREFYPCDVWFIPQTWGDWCEKPKFWPSHAYGPWPTGLSVVSDEVFGNEFYTDSLRVALGAIGYAAPTINSFGFEY